MVNDKQLVARKILETVPLVMRTVAAEMRQADQFFSTAHFRSLWVLNSKACSLSELAEYQSVSLPTMSNSVTILEERGWAKRTRSPEDHRRVIIEITDEGRMVLQDVRDQSEKRVVEILGDLPDADLDQLEAGLTILRNAFIGAFSQEYCSKKHPFNKSED